MSNRIKKLSEQHKKEMLYMAMVSLSFRSSDIIPELLHIMDSETFIKMVNIYAGKCLKMPSKREIARGFQVLLYHHDVKICGMDEDEFFKKHDITLKWISGIRQRARKFANSLDTLKLPKGFARTGFIKKLEGTLWKKK